VFNSVGTPTLWVAFLVGVLFMLALDLGVFHRKSQSVSVKEALAWSVVWVCLSLSFNGVIYYLYGKQLALEFLSAYLIEKSLSVDNLFVFLVIFRYMDVRPQVMHRVLFAGILGALVLRAIFILAGIGLIETFSWTLYIFGGFLLFTGIKLLLPGEEDFDPSENFAYRLAKRVLPLTRGYVGDKFWTRQKGKLHATPLFIVLMMIETSDVVFALDSIPAVFGISRDPFIVFSSNVCAVLGLRAMFFLLQHVIDKFAYLKYGLGLVLAFIGAKMWIEEGIPGVFDPVHVPIMLSLGIVAALLFLSMLISALLPPPGKPVSQQLAEQPEASILANIDHTITPGVSVSDGDRPKE
jgi:tellurite resistance protein TerC